MDLRTVMDVPAYAVRLRVLQHADPPDERYAESYALEMFHGDILPQNDWSWYEKSRELLHDASVSDCAIPRLSALACFIVASKIRWKIQWTFEIELVGMFMV